MKISIDEKEESRVNSRLNESVEQAMKDTFRDMLRAKISNGEPTALPINHTSGTCSETTVIISFVGEISGALMLKCSKRAGSVIATRMLGMNVEAGSDEMKEALGELLNIIIGTAKSYFSPESKFRISIPTTIIGENYSLYIKANAGNTVSFIPFRSGTVKLDIEIYLI